MKLKKSLGQNFFNNAHLAEKIVDITCASNPNYILEIGPGDGYFTSLFEQKVDGVVAVEKDSRMAELLNVKLRRTEIIEADFLDLDMDSIKSVSGETVCFGSLPYNSSKKIIAKLLSQAQTFPEYFFIIQKEVADKYVRTESDTSILSIMTKLYADSKVHFDIKPGSFTPPPKVTSSFIQFTPNLNLSLVKDLKLFTTIVKTAFGNPRKMLRNNLKGYSIENPDILQKRPGELSFQEYVDLANSLR